MRDLTQVQGAFVQGFGQYTQEKVILDPNTAAVISDSTLVKPLLYYIILNTIKRHNFAWYKSLQN